MNAVLALIAALTLGAAVAALSRRNLLHSVLLLAGSWTGVAAFFLWAGAEFAAFAQLLVYLGAISMVVLFAVLLTRRSRELPPPEPAARRRVAAAVAAGLAVAGVLLAAVARTPFAADSRPAPVLTVRQIGERLMAQQAAALLVTAVLLTVALIGAVVIASGPPAGETEGPP
jgi:NADH:ubiquinone oxidoreductase subunit 6 (subunit J)